MHFELREGINNSPMPTCPQADTVMLSLLHLLIFLITAIFAITFPTIQVKRVVIAVNTLLASALGMAFIIDVATRKSKRNSTNICFGY
jgi:hypothetical protein